MCDYRVMELTEDPQTSGPDQAARQALAGGGWAAKLSDVLVASAPTIAFLVANSMSSLNAGLIAAGVTAVAACAWRVQRKEKLRQAVLGLLVVAACAAVAAYTGQARGFFLLPLLLPFIVIAACLGGLMAGWPLAGVLLNKVGGGPADWRAIPRLRNVYVVSTWVCIAADVLNAILQVVYYRGNDTVALGIVHIATTPTFAVIFTVTITFARRAMPARRPRTGAA